MEKITKDATTVTTETKPEKKDTLPPIEYPEGCRHYLVRYQSEQGQIFSAKLFIKSPQDAKLRLARHIGDVKILSCTLWE